MLADSTSIVLYFKSVFRKQNRMHACMQFFLDTLKPNLYEQVAL